MLVLIVLYMASAIGLAVFGLNSFIMLALYLRHRKQAAPIPPMPQSWPRVVVQLPIYNERHVVERLIDAVAALDYPSDRVSIQVLDDSSDDTASIVEKIVAVHQAQGVDIRHIRRESREGYKAGALAYGLQMSDAILIAVFDADFVPRPDFLRRMVPHFADERIGMVQARWSHLNAHYDALTRAQAIALDTHFVIEQTARQRSGLFMNFSGTAGVWRRTCIDDSGGWEMDTLSEDIDLSYRAQIRGWKLLYLPDVDAPAEIPPQIAAFKRQQARWATGTVQVLLKLWKPLFTSKLTVWQRVEGVLHLSGYFIHPLLLILLLSSVPLMLTGGLLNVPLAPLGLAALGPPLMAVVAQTRLYDDWLHRLMFFPFLLLIGAGIAVSNTLAVARALLGKPQVFRRTPKFELHASSGSEDGRWTASRYALPFDRSTLLELALAVYAMVGAGLAVSRTPGLVPFLLLYSFGFGYVGVLGLWQGWRIRSWQRNELAPLGSGAD